MSRLITDADLLVTKALPAAGASANSASIDLGGASIASLEAIELKVDLPILPDLVDDKTVILTVEDSADDSSFTAVDGLGTLTATGTLTPGSAAALTRTYKLPSNTRRYVRVSAAVLTAGGDNTGVSFTWQILT